MIVNRLTAAALILALTFGGASLAQDAPTAQEAEPPQETPTVDSVVLVHGEAPLPIVGRGQPNLSPEQTASYICENQDAGLFRMVTGPVRQAAHDATIAARQARIDFPLGRITEAQMIDAELERQKAIDRIVNGDRLRITDPQPVSKEGLRVRNVAYTRALENGRPVLTVTGEVFNTSSETRELPPLSMRAFDVRGFYLAGQTVQLDDIELAAGASTRFALRFKNPPAYTTQVTAHLAPPFETRNFRGCDFFDPLEFDPNESAVRRNVARRGAAPPVPVPQVGEGAPRYTLPQLAAMTQRARREAQMAFESKGALCADIPGRRDWRVRMILADRIEEAWIASSAAEEVRRDAAQEVFLPEEVAEAELARQRTVRAFLAERPVVTPPPVGYPGLSISEVEVSESGDNVRVSARLTNASPDNARYPPMHIVLRDKSGFVVLESFQRAGGSVRAERDERFSFNFELAPGLVDQARIEFAC